MFSYNVFFGIRYYGLFGVNITITVIVHISFVFPLINRAAK